MRALILSGGGARGVFQAGVLRYLLDHDSDLDYDVYAGVSVGSLNAALLASDNLNETLPKLEEIWLNQIKDNSSVWSHHLWRYILAAIYCIVVFTIFTFVSFILSAPKIITIFLAIIAAGLFYIPYYALNNTHSIYNNNELGLLIKKNLDLDKLRNNNKKLLIGAVSFTTGDYKVITKHDTNLPDWLMASSAFPVLFPMPHLENQYWTDGGIIDLSMVDNVLHLGATEIDIIVTNPINPGSYNGLPGVLKQLVRHIDIISSEILRNIIASRTSIPGIKMRIFIPEHQLTNNFLSFDSNRIARMYDDGKKLAAKVVKY